MHNFSIFFKELNKTCVIFPRVWTKNAGLEILENTPVRAITAGKHHIEEMHSSLRISYKIRLNNRTARRYLCRFHWEWCELIRDYELLK